MSDLKPTNPKDAIGSKKLPMHLVPDVINVYASMAFLEGALKYGKFNWRVAGVRMSIYLDAIERHLAKFRNGEWCDRVTAVPHLSSVLACIGIILDAGLSGKLTDDRAPMQLNLSPFIDGQDKLVAHLKELYKNHAPHQHIIGDPHGNDTGGQSEGGDRRAAARTRSVSPQARAKRNGKARS